MQWMTRQGLIGAIAVCWGLLMLLVPGLAWADDAPTATTMNDLGISEITDSGAISSQKVSQFANAYMGIVDLISGRSEELQQAETAQEYNQLEQELEAAAIEIIQQEGLTPPEYLQLLTLADNDAEFSERVATQIQDFEE
ncbi:DUF4168 domain-containing protein [Geitlerinema sp. P-1104]|uniref:DUF4168 domain-containing protein n=1 Tax=Geitlerinema sp. P-1104 TaxID=2546230 RepID=UPI00147731EC|nr:DUF4168 domain-containing protein [Geitlerinema sp. P-1104]NMG60131.1 DUF4168 domain-containing protein [Geitlerinema sp. P-1104]